MNKTISNYVFHFTGIKDQSRSNFKSDDESINTIKSILSERMLKYSANKRNIVFVKEPKSCIENIAVHMCCLTETPLEYLKNHILIFGRFGIGLTIEWAIKKGALNVIYYDNSNPNILGEVLEEIYGKFYDSINLKMNTDLKWDHTFAGTEDIKYRDERELRFIKNTSEDIKGVSFNKKDLKYIFIPKNYNPELEKFLKNDSIMKHWKGKTLFVEDILNER